MKIINKNNIKFHKKKKVIIHIHIQKKLSLIVWKNMNMRNMKKKPQTN